MKKKKINDDKVDSTKTIIKKPITVNFIGSFKVERRCEPFEIKLSTLRFCEQKIEKKNKLITLTLEPLHFLYNQFPFISIFKAGSYEFRNRYLLNKKNYTIIKESGQDDYSGYKIKLIITPRFIEFIDFEMYRKEWFMLLKKRYEQLTEGNEFAYEVTIWISKLLTHVIDTQIGQDVFDKNYSRNYEIFFGMPIDMVEVSNMRMMLLKYLSNYPKQLQPVDFSKFGIKVLAINDFLKFVNTTIRNFDDHVGAKSKHTKHLAPVNKDPHFKPDSIDTVFGILKNYFPKRETQLKNVLKTGIISNEKLVFNGPAKTLLDFFKQLLKGQFLSISVQKDLEEWISNGFKSTYRGKEHPITQKYASKIISGNERAAKGNRLIDIKRVNGNFEIAQLEITNRQ